MSELTPKENSFILYTTPEGAVKLTVLLQDETIWLTQKAMGILFDTTPQNITIHLKNSFESGELNAEATCKENLQVQMESLANSVDKFLNFKEFKILDGKGTKSHQQAISKAGKEYDHFNKTQKIISDFDKQIKKLKE